MTIASLTGLILGQFAVTEVPPAPPPPPPPAVQAIHKGAKNVSFGFWQTGLALGRPNGSVGGAFFVTDRLAISLQAKVDLDRITLNVPSSPGRETLTQLSVSLAPAARYYLNPCRPVASYVSLGLVGGYTRKPETSSVAVDAGSGQVTNDGFLDIQASFGAEWFVVPAVSLSGELGVAAEVVRPDSKPVPSFGTLASLLQANFYW